MNKALLTICLILLIGGCSESMSDSIICGVAHLMAGPGSDPNDFMTSAERREQEKQRRQQYIEQHHDIDEQTKEYILAGKAAIGMTKEQVLASIGQPRDVHKSVGPWGVHEQWIYGTGIYYRQLYLYFENGILTAFQD